MLWLLPLLALAGDAEHTVAVKVGVGMPTLIHAHVELYFNDVVSLELGGGFGLLPVAIEGGPRFRPPKLHYAAGMHHASLRFGPTATIFPGGRGTEWMLTGDVDGQWTVGHFLLGARLGLGLTSGVEAPTRIEPAITVVPLQLGAVF